MKQMIPALGAVLALAACSGDETVAAYGGAGPVWILESIDGQEVAAPTTLVFESGGRISGRAPCNGYSGTQTVPYPWFAVDGVTATRRACPDLAAEHAYFSALRAMDQSEISGAVLRLSNAAGREMVFRAEPAEGQP